MDEIEHRIDGSMLKMTVGLIPAWVPKERTRSPFDALSRRDATPWGNTHEHPVQGPAVV